MTKEEIREIHLGVLMMLDEHFEKMEARENLVQPDVIKSVCECGEPVHKEYNDCCSYQCWKKKYD